MIALHGEFKKLDRGLVKQGEEKLTKRLAKGLVTQGFWPTEPGLKDPKQASFDKMCTMVLLIAVMAYEWIERLTK